MGNLKDKDVIEAEIFNALKFHKNGYYYYSVPTSVRRSGQVKISKKKYNSLLLKFGKPHKQ